MKLDLKNTFFFARYVFDCRGEGYSNRNASRDESVEAGDKSVEAGMNLSKPGKNTAIML